MSGRRALVTGLTGQDGSYLAESLLGDGWEVHGVVRDPGDLAASPIAALADRLTIVQADLLDPSSLSRAIATAMPSELYHLAAPTFVPDSWERPQEIMDAIAGATDAILAAAGRLASPPRVFVATSAEIFGDSGESPQSESSPKRPRTPYGEAKLAAHELVSRSRAGGLFAVSGIAFNHESPRRPLRFLPRKVTNAAAAIALGQQEKLTLGDLDAVRDWSDARDIMRAARLSLAADEPGDYVLASGVGRTVRQLVEAAFSAAGVDPAGRIEVDPAFVRPPEPTPPVGDPSRARSLLGWQPTISFEETIGEMVAADLRLLGS